MSVTSMRVRPVARVSMTSTGGAASFLDDLRRSTGTGDTVVVAHGGSIRMLRAVLAQHALDGLAWDAVPNASICRVELPRLTA